jgi:hypothetical protein
MSQSQVLPGSIKSWAAGLLTRNPAAAPTLKADTTQHEIVFDTIMALPPLAPVVSSQACEHNVTCKHFDACPSKTPSLDCGLFSDTAILESPIGTHPVLQLHDVITINAREGQFPMITETREGIAGSTIEAREEQTCWCHDLSCMPAPPVINSYHAPPVTDKLPLFVPTFKVDDSNIQPDGLSTISRTWSTDTMKCKAAVEWESCLVSSPYPLWSDLTVNLQDVQIHPDIGTILGSGDAQSGLPDQSRSYQLMSCYYHASNYGQSSK